MKKVFTLFFILSTLRLSAQQLPQYTQYTFNEALINPAVTGIESYWDVKTGYRSQWSGLQGAPTTAYVTLSVPLNKNFTLNDYTQMLTNGQNPMGRPDDYSASASHSGLGFSMVSDKTGEFKQTHIDASYAYHIRVTNKFNFAAGASFGINNINLNTSQLVLVNPLDPAISQGSNSQYTPEAGLGVWAYGPSFFIGASAQQLIPRTISFTGNPVYNQGATYAQYFFTAGVKIYMDDDVTLLPSMTIKPKDPDPLTYDANVKMAFRDNFWIGGAYRKSDAISGSFGFNIGSFLTVGYAYDHTTSDLSTVSSGTHEIMIGLFLNNNYNTTSPRHTW